MFYYHDIKGQKIIGGELIVRGCGLCKVEPRAGKSSLTVQLTVTIPRPMTCGVRKAMGCRTVDGGSGTISLMFTRKIKNSTVKEADEFGLRLRVDFEPEESETKNEDEEKGKKTKKAFSFGVGLLCFCNFFFLCVCRREWLEENFCQTNLRKK